MNRIQRLQTKISTPCLIERSSDLFYLTGLHLSKGRLYVSPQEAVLFVDGRYFAKAEKEAPCAVRIWEEQKNLKGPVGFDSTCVTYEGYLGLTKELSLAELSPIANPLKPVRAIKDQEEILSLRKAAKLTLAGIEHVISQLQVGVTEEEMAWAFELFCREKGASGLSFESIVAFGENSAYPHHRAGKKKLEKDQIVLIDVGAIVDEYHGDMTRVFHFGEVDPKIAEYEEIVRRAQQKAFESVKPGVKLGLLDQIVREEFDKANVKQLYIHNLGHGVGLETHEFPRIRFDGEDRDLQMEPGLVVTIEPGLYQPGLGGIRIEDMVLVTQTGGERLA